MVPAMSESSGPSTAAGQESRRSLRVVQRITSVVGVVVIVAVLAAAVGVLAGWRPSLNPFRLNTIDRTGSPVLKSLTDLSEYHAASAHYETVVDLDKDANNLPSWISGERVLYVGKGDVDAIVDFGELDERRVVLSPDAKSVSIALPAPTADKPVLNLETSYVVDHEKGLINRFRGSALEREAQLRAITQMTTAATSEGLLTDRAKENTSMMLRGLFGSLGYTSITITFDEDPS
jgi:hypothetical protein